MSSKHGYPFLMMFVGITALAGCQRSISPSNHVGAPSPSKSSPAAAISVPDWMNKPPKDWPQIVLTNEATFKEHSGLKGASCFLVETPRAAIMLATALHLIGEAGGVDPPIPADKLDSVLVSWKAHRRTEPDRGIEAANVVAAGPEKGNIDWLVLSIKKSASLPATPLKVRSAPVEIGEKVFLIGCPYIEPNCKQNVYEGKVTKRAYGNAFQYTLEPYVDLRGFSGAPIIDAKGYVVGVMTIWFNRVMNEGKDTLGGGEDATFVANALKDK